MIKKKTYSSLKESGTHVFFSISRLFPVHKHSGGSVKAHKIAALPRASLELIEAKRKPKKNKSHNSTLFCSVAFYLFFEEL